jgi:hemolysin-activating ACP:hemolysin acyltransferase
VRDASELVGGRIAFAWAPECRLGGAMAIRGLQLRKVLTIVGGGSTAAFRVHTRVGPHDRISSRTEARRLVSINKAHSAERDPALPRSLDPAQLGAAASKLFAASIGDIVVVLSRSPAHKHYSLADIEWMVMPAVSAGQFYIAEMEDKQRGFRAPIAVVTWALVSEEVDRRLESQAGQLLRLRPDEWKSGTIGWLIGAAGSPAGVKSALRWLGAGPFKDRTLKVDVREAGSAAMVGTLGDVMKREALSRTFAE